MMMESGQTQDRFFTTQQTKSIILTFEGEQDGERVRL
jgi:hypothetical protein